MKNKDVADILEKFGDVLEFKGESFFKINAYRRAAREILELPDDINVYRNEGRLGEIPGVGSALQKKIEQFLAEGKITQLEEHLKECPKELFELLSVQYFGPKTAALAFNELGVETLADLRGMILNGRLATLPGMGPKKVENILKSLDMRQKAEDYFSISLAWPILYELVEYLQKECRDKINRIEPAGSTRRFKETVHDVDILVETDHGESVIHTFTQFPKVTRILGSGSTKGSVMLQDRFQADLRAIPTAAYGAAQQYFTGSQAHNVKLREIAKKKGLKINEYGVFKGDEQIGGEKEKDIYHALGMAWIPPELREDRGEIQAALEDALPNLIMPQDIKADLHMHTTMSDGRDSLEAMVETARTRGYEYIAICDHSKSTVYGKGLSEDRLLQAIDTIGELNKSLSDFTILVGSEIEILPDGALDYDDDLLAQLDFAVGSIHQRSGDHTARYVAAMQSPFIDVIAHPTGRLISRREPMDVNIDKLIKTAVETGTALEVNAMWDRLDLQDIYIKKAVEQGAKLSINTDSHRTEGLAQMMLGVGTARRGWAKASDVINTFSLSDLKKWQKRNRK